MPRQTIPHEVAAWAGGIEHGPGEENERTLYFADDPDKDGCVQVWHDTEHSDGGHRVGFFATNYRNEEVSWSLTVEQALALAADLVTCADIAVEAQDEEDHER